MTDLAIVGGRVVDPGQGIDGRLGVAIADGRVAALGEAAPAADESEVGHRSRPAGRRASVAENAATVRSTSASVCAALRKPEP